jgi:hypothetical protein
MPRYSQYRDTGPIFFIAHELVAIVGESVTVNNHQIAAFEVERNLRKDTQLKPAAIDFSDFGAALFFTGDQPPPFVGNSCEIESLVIQPSRQPFLPSGFVFRDKAYCPLKALICSRSDQIRLLKDR